MSSARPAKKQKVDRREQHWELTDAALWCPTALVGTPVRVFWPAEGRFFSGKIAKYCSASYEHEVHYDDGDEETLVLAVEKVQLPSNCISNLLAPSVCHLASLARHLDGLADKVEAKAAGKRTARGRTMLKEEDRQRLDLLRRRAADVRSVRDRREALLDGKQVTYQAPLSGIAAEPLALTPNRLQRAAAIHAVAAVASAHGHGSTTPKQLPQQHTRPPPQPSTLGLAPVSKQPAAPAQRHHASGNGAPAAYVYDKQRSTQRTSEPECVAISFRICSPDLARRRQSLLTHQARKQARGQGQGANAEPAEGPPGCGAGSSPLRAGSQPNQVQGSVAIQRGADADQQVIAPPPIRTGPGAWGSAPRNGRSGLAADTDVGKLYVPRAWPAVRASASASATCVEEGADRKSPAEGGGAKQQPGRGEAPQVPVPGHMAGPADEANPPEETHVGQEDGVDSTVGSEAATKGRLSAEERRRIGAAAAELRLAYKHYRRHCPGFKQYHEIQVALWLAPEQLVGREIRVLWPDEGAWFCGRVTHFDTGSGMHTVEYDDGDVEHLHLAAEEVRLQVVPGDAERGLAPRPPEDLLRAAAYLAVSAAQLQQRAEILRRQKDARKPAHRTKPAKGGATHGNSSAEDEEDAEELVGKAERWSARSAHLQALAAIMQREAAGGHQTTSAGRQRLQLTTACDGEMASGAAECLAREGCSTSATAVAAQAAAAGNAHGPAQRPGPVRAEAGITGKATLRAGVLAAPASAAAGADVVGAERQQPELRAASDDAHVAAADSRLELPRNWASTQVLRPGEVVWAQVRRSMPWPAIIITREEAEREGLRLRARHATTAGGPGEFAFVRFFGDHTVLGLPVVEAGARIPDRGGVLPFLAGLDLGWHVRCTAGAVGGGAWGSTGALSQRFLRAMFELRTYMADGELPRGMIPLNYDEDEDYDEGEQEPPGEALGGDAAAAAAGTFQRAANRDGGGSGSADADRSVSLPLVLGPKMRVLQLGRVVWLSRWFHDEKYIYPVGYKAARVMASGASGGRPVQHLMEVVASDDGVRPVFRITPEGEPPVSADTATRAMRALFEDDVRASGRAFARTGADLFGLSSPRVAALIRALPGAERCERYANWPDQDRPALPTLTPYEELQRRALYARALRLPSGVQAVPRAKAGMCFECEVCGEDEEVPGNLKLECDLCRCVVHSRCYGVKQPPHGALWLCDVCQLHAAGLPLELSPPCELCPVVGGPMKRSEAGGWVHLLCAVWTPGCTYGNPRTLEPVQGVAKAVQSRSSLRCFLCKQPHGACIQCSGDARCYTAFHPMCAREAGLAMCEVRPGERAARAAATRQRQPGAGGAVPAAVVGSFDRGVAGMEVDEGKENRPEAANMIVAATAGAAWSVTEAAAGDAKEGSLDMTRAKAAAAAPSADAASRLGVNAAAAAEAAAAAATATATTMPLQRRCRGRGRPRRDCRSGTRAGAGRLGRGGGIGDGCLDTLSLGNGISLACFCPRHEDLVLHQPHFRCSYPGGRFADRRAEVIREQLRARRQQLMPGGNAVEVDQSSLERPHSEVHQQEVGTAAKRADAVAGAGGGGSEDERPTGRAMSFADWRSRGHRAPEAVAIAREKRTFVRQLPYLVTGRLQQDERALAGLEVRCVRFDAGGLRVIRSNPGGRDARARGSSATHQAGGAEVADAAASGGADGGQRVGSVGGLSRQLVEAATAAGARSVAERYAAMRATVGRRLAAGKSAIHGWGAFAKVPHRRGDMLIEYVGELIRPSVSDARERRMYDKLVGSGTYIFTLNDEQHIDATRAGNMAHLLNHSCSPNCYSRTITLTNDVTGATSDHVIITAKRDIEAGEELTYDYRFNSAEELPCNCGAATCRLLVNWPEQADGPEEEEEEEEDGEKGELAEADGEAKGAAVREGGLVPIWGATS